MRDNRLTFLEPLRSVTLALPFSLSNAPVGDELVSLARDLDADVLEELSRLTYSMVDQAWH
jgi:hypothetical protein